MLGTAELERIHKFSINHRNAISMSNLCYCFYCCQTFKAVEIKEWIDMVGKSFKGHTALCPKCGIDSVIGDKDMPSFSSHDLREMREYWF
jgi:hypothetical protein